MCWEKKSTESPANFEFQENFKNKRNEFNSLPKYKLLEKEINENGVGKGMNKHGNR